MHGDGHCELYARRVRGKILRVPAASHGQRKRPLFPSMAMQRRYTFRPHYYELRRRSIVSPCAAAEEFFRPGSFLGFAGWADPTANNPFKRFNFAGDLTDIWRRRSLKPA